MIFKFLKDFLWPKYCTNCWKEGMFLCEKCHNVFWKYIYRKDDENQFLDWIFVYWDYKNDKLSKLIKDAKYRKLKDVFDDFWFHLNKVLLHFFSYVDTNCRSWHLSRHFVDNAILTYAPSFFLKEWTRWYNQAKILCESVSCHSWLKMSTLLVKSRHTKAQASLSAEDRRTNLLSSFKINKKVWKIPKIVIIIDDVVTTWATTNEMARVLKSFWAQKVFVLAIATNIN